MDSTFSRTTYNPNGAGVTPPGVEELVAEGGHIELSLSGATIRLYGDVGEGRIRTVLRALQ